MGKETGPGKGADQEGGQDERDRQGEAADGGEPSLKDSTGGPPPGERDPAKEGGEGSREAATITQSPTTPPAPASTAGHSSSKYFSSQFYRDKLDKIIGDDHTHSLLHDDIDRALLLISFASTNGKIVNEEDARVIYQSEETFAIKGDAGFSVDDRVNFYKAKTSVAKALAPVTANSIEACFASEDGADPEAKKFLKRMRFGFYDLFFVVLIIHLFSLVGDRTAHSIDQLLIERTTLKTEYFTAAAAWENAEQRLAAYTLADPLASDGGTEGDDQQYAVLAEKEEAAAVPKERAADSLCKNANLIAANATYHWWWLETLYYLIPETINLTEAVTTADPLIEWCGEPDAVSIDHILTRSSKDEDFLNNLQVASSLALNGMNAFILPLLYGVLGAWTYVLRTLADEIAKVSFSLEKKSGYKVRLALGMLAGLLMGWFGEMAVMEAGLSQLSPLALAFLAGYSIELVFSFMDEIIRKLVGGESRQSVETRATLEQVADKLGAVGKLDDATLEAIAEKVAKKGEGENK